MLTFFAIVAGVQQVACTVVSLIPGLSGLDANPTVNGKPCKSVVLRVAFFICKLGYQSDCMICKNETGTIKRHRPLMGITANNVNNFSYVLACLPLCFALTNRVYLNQPDTGQPPYST